MSENNQEILHPNSLGKIIYNYYATVLKVISPVQFAVMIDLGFGCHKRLNVKLYELDYHKETEEKAKILIEKILKDTRNLVMYFSYDPDSDGFMQAVIKSHNGIHNINKILLDNNYVFVKEELGF